MSDKIKRVYVDNSVVSGMFDGHMPERVEHMRQFWQAVIDGKIRIIASDVLDEEVADAPQRVRNFYHQLPESQIERVESTKESNDLATQYIGANVISEKHLNDCKHVALGTITRADVIVSLNCDDMVNPDRIPKYNEVNVTQGYKRIDIKTPNEFMEAHYDST